MLEESKREKLVLNQQLTNIKPKVKLTHTKTVKLIHERMEIEKQLELREQEIEFLKNSNLKEHQQVQSIIRQREEEIKQLKEQLSVVEGQLISERKQAQDLRKQLNQTEKELVAKSAEAQELERSICKLETYLDFERKRVDLLLMQMTAASSQQQHTKELEVCILCIVPS